MPDICYLPGYVGGSWYTSQGSGANTLCLADNPEYGPVVTGAQTYVGWIHGTEYEFWNGYAPNNQPFSLANNNGAGLGNNNVPCVVCFRDNKTDVLMIPGKMNCPLDSMSLEYTGYLVTTYEVSPHWRTEFICLDNTPEVVPGMSANQDGHLLYPVLTSCLSLTCPPYIHGREATCAVCTI